MRSNVTCLESATRATPIQKLGGLFLLVVACSASQCQSEEPVERNRHVAMTCEWTLDESSPNTQLPDIDESVNDWLTTRLRGVATVQSTDMERTIEVRTSEVHFEEAVWRIWTFGRVTIDSAPTVQAKLKQPSEKQATCDWILLSGGLVGDAELFTEFLCRRRNDRWEVAIESPSRSLSGASIESAELQTFGKRQVLQIDFNQWPEAPQSPRSGAIHPTSDRFLLVMDGTVAGWGVSPLDARQRAFFDFGSAKRAASMLSVFEAGVWLHGLRLELSQVKFLAGE